MKNEGQSAPCETVTITCRKQKRQGPYHPGDTVFEAARRLGLRPPSSCLNGICATCMAKLVAGSVTMKKNEALTPEETAAGYILTCQSLPTSKSVTVVYED